MTGPFYGVKEEDPVSHSIPLVRIEIKDLERSYDMARDHLDQISAKLRERKAHLSNLERMAQQKKDDES